jgi:hypothetical protein
MLGQAGLSAQEIAEDADMLVSVFKVMQFEQYVQPALKRTSAMTCWLTNIACALTSNPGTRPSDRPSPAVAPFSSAWRPSAEASPLPPSLLFLLRPRPVRLFSPSVPLAHMDNLHAKSLHITQVRPRLAALLQRSRARLECSLRAHPTVSQDRRPLSHHARIPSPNASSARLSIRPSPVRRPYPSACLQRP